ncbi:periplasmic heavy metal sensor [Oceaniglobus ichthyenteri]|uniref:periplasmic heavy metal sensor n=1 Tax=Oceaniglobus ichthyenteri TaxID=2136177 RepID=UPI000D39E4B6|nr:periplasmic heavy metal sensor [Oceaniglobus ichthyenteri]
MTKKMRVLLIASLALNLLVAGVVVGGMVTHGRDDTKRSSDYRALRDIGNVPYVMALTPEDRSALAQTLKPRQERLSNNREALRARFEAALEVLRTDPFDADMLRGLLAQQRAILSERQQLGEELLIARLQEMSVAERTNYANRLDRSLRRGPRKPARD